MLHGCSTADMYTEPTDHKAANLRITTSNPTEFKFCLAVATVNPTTCKGDKIIGGISCRPEADEKRLGMPESVPPRDGVLERKIPSNKTFSIAPLMLFQDIDFGDLVSSPSKYVGLTLGACRVPMFTPEESGNYQIDFSIAPGNCDVKLYKFDNNGTRTDITNNQQSFVELISNNNNTGSLLCEEKGDDWVE